MVRVVCKTIDTGSIPVGASDPVYPGFFFKVHHESNRVRSYQHRTIKYWENVKRIQPARHGQLEFDAQSLCTETTVRLYEGERDQFILNDQHQSGIALEKVSTFLDLIRTQSEKASKAVVESINHVPTAAGLASSASAFAALALAASRVYDIKDQSAKSLSLLARQGSGSGRSVSPVIWFMRKGSADGGLMPMRAPSMVIIRFRYDRHSL